jgi:hypothetical protein
MKPFEEQDIVEKLTLRAEIRRKIKRSPDGKPDRIADTCEEAAAEITRLRTKVKALENPLTYKDLLGGGPD